MAPPRVLVLLAACLSSQVPMAASAAESYDNCTDFIDSVPTTISTQGVWCLRHNLSTAITLGAAITIAGNNITIDCNDFKLGGLAAGDLSAAKGILASNRQNITVRNCSIRGFWYGISLEQAGSGHLVEDNRLDNNLVRGIYVSGSHNLVRRNRVFDTGGYAHPENTRAIGIVVVGDAIDNIVDGAYAVTDSAPEGIVLNGQGSVARGNLVRGLIAEGAGTAAGIVSMDPNQEIAGNSVLGQYGTATAGTGIERWAGNPGLPSCRDNTIAGFTTAMSGCHNDGGNVVH